MTRAAASARVLLALLILAALLSTTVGAARDGLLPQHLSYFTNQSNAFFVVLTLASLAPAARRIPWWDDARGAVTFYLAMTGIVYALLVAPLDELLRWDIGWTGIVLHRLAPLAALIDWALTLRRRTPPAGRILWWQLYPVAFLALTWARGGFTTWYPYEFLDPTATSWGQVLLTTAGVLIAFVAVAAAVHLLEGRARPQEVPARRAQPVLS